MENGVFAKFTKYSLTPNTALEKIELARKLPDCQKSVEESIQTIEEGWVGEEALAISIYCSLKFSDNFERGTLAAVNHSGDSDTTGSITGAILGTLFGVESIPGHWLRDVENSDRIKEIANDMFSIFKNGKNFLMRNTHHFNNTSLVK